MRSHSNVSLVPAERAATWPRPTQAGGAAARRAADAADAEVVRGPQHTRGDANIWCGLLDLYLEGWAQANPHTILAATAHDYRFDDPLVGAFSRRTLPVYFAHLQAKFGSAGAITAQDLAFFIHGPLDGLHRRGRQEFFREAPRIGLTGITVITIGERGIISERVAYDLNLASDVLRNPAREMCRVGSA